MTQSTALASFNNLAPDREDFRADVLRGLGEEPKNIPCKYYYDKPGSDLFQKICNLPEYYPTRTETTLLRDLAVDFCALAGPGCFLIEYGTGSSKKMRIVLDALDAPTAYAAIDISREHLLEVTTALAKDLPGLAVHAICADFTQPFQVPDAGEYSTGRRLAFFPGSSLGNFMPDAAVGFLTAAAEMVGAGGAMLIGIDLKKNEKILNAAYNDAQGVTAAFNLNLLARVNRELGGTFDLDAFLHHAFYNAAEGRIEMHLMSRRAQTAEVAGQTFAFAEGETIHTEHSHKYGLDEFRDLARRAGFIPVKAWTDAQNLFSVHYLSVEG